MGPQILDNFSAAVKIAFVIGALVLTGGLVTVGVFRWMKLRKPRESPESDVDLERRLAEAQRHAGVGPPSEELPHDPTAQGESREPAPPAENPDTRAILAALERVALSLELLRNQLPAGLREIKDALSGLPASFENERERRAKEAIHRQQAEAEAARHQTIITLRRQLESIQKRHRTYEIARVTTNIVDQLQLLGVSLNEQIDKIAPYQSVCSQSMDIECKLSAALDGHGVAVDQPHIVDQLRILDKELDLLDASFLKLRFCNLLDMAEAVRETTGEAMALRNLLSLQRIEMRVGLTLYNLDEVDVRNTSGTGQPNRYKVTHVVGHGYIDRDTGKPLQKPLVDIEFLDDEKVRGTSAK